MASATNRVSQGSSRSAIAATSSISSASTCRRPAVSTSTAPRPRSRASASARSHSASGVSPAAGSSTGTPAASPTCCSCSTAAARCRSAATSSGCRPPCLRRWPSLPAVVVLPEPWRPQSSTTGGRPSSWSSPPGSPSSSTSSSRTILTTCWAAVRLSSTCSPSARSRIRATKPLTTLKLTSASSSAMRISRSARLSASSLTLPSPLSRRKTPWSLSWRPSNMAGAMVDQPRPNAKARPGGQAHGAGNARRPADRHALPVGR